MAVAQRRARIVEMFDHVEHRDRVEAAFISADPFIQCSDFYRSREVLLSPRSGDGAWLQPDDGELVCRCADEMPEPGADVQQPAAVDMTPYPRQLVACRIERSFVFVVVRLFLEKRA